MSADDDQFVEELLNTVDLTPQPDWESVCIERDIKKGYASETMRLRVPGGWLYRTTVNDGAANRVAMVFVAEVVQ